MITKTKPKLHFSRKLLAIPYGLFLALFVVLPLLIIVYYAFFNDNGIPDWTYIKIFFAEDFGSKIKTIGISFFISFASTLICLLIAYPVAYIIAKCKEQVPVVERGQFGADMKVELINDGPVTIMLEK